MAQSGTDPDFFAKINKIVNYFARTPGGGFLFCSYESIAVLDEIIETIKYRAEERELNLKEVFLSLEDAEYFLPKIKEAAREKPGGIIISNLDELVVLTKDQIITEINLARDILLGLNLPILFCVSRENISKFANQAQDLFLRRDRGVIHFSNIPGVKIWEQFRKLRGMEYRESVDVNGLNLKIELLENQLKEAEGKKYKPGRIANEIALDLIQLYLDASLVKEAKKLFRKYKSYLNLKDHLKTLKVVANLYRKSSRWGWGALKLCFRRKKIYKQTGDLVGLADTLNDIGMIYIQRFRWNKALEYFIESKNILEQVVETTGLYEATLSNIGFAYFLKRESTKALEYYIRAREIFERIGNQGGLKNAERMIGLIKRRNS